MSKIDDDRRYYPYYRSKNYNDRRYDDEDYRRQYKKNNKHYYQYSSSSRHDDDRLNNRNYNDFSYRRSHRHDYRHQHQSSKANSHTYFSSPPPPPPSLMSCQIPPPPPPPPPPLLTVVPHERESWIRSVKKTKTNESTEQKTQYLETMLRMPQQKSLLNSTRFDRMRFASNQLFTSTTTTTTANNDNLDDNSFHLIRDINDHDDIRTLEAILFDSENQQQQQQQNLSDESLDQKSLPTPPIIECEPSSKTNSEVTLGLGFLIDNCDEEELPPLSPPPRPLLPPLPSSSDELMQQSDEDIHEQRVMLVSELDAADAEQRQELKHQKRLHKRLQQKKNKTKIESKPISTPQDNDKQESSSDWILEYDMNGPNQVSQLTDEVRRTSITMTDEDKTAKVNMILMKIKKQQGELKKLRQYVMSMLGEQEKRTSTKRQNANIAQDLLMAFLNQPVKSGCWLCSGKAYAEIATQCDDTDE